MDETVGDCDVGGTTSGLLNSSDLQDTVGIDFKDGLQDWLTSLHWWDVLQVELTQQGVLNTVDTFTLVDWELDGGAVVFNGGESSSLDGWNSGVSWNNWSKDVTLHGDTQGQWDDIQQQQVFGLIRGGLTGQDSTLNSGTVGNGFIWVDRFLQLLTVKEVGQQLLYFWNSGRTTNQDDFVNLGLGDLRVLQDAFNWGQGRLEQSRVDVFESGSGDVSREVFTIEQRVNFNGGAGDRGQSSLGTFTGGSQSSQGSGVLRDVQTGLLLEFSLEVVQQVGVEIATTQMGVTSGSLDGENTTGNVQQGNIESSSTQVEDQNVSFLFGLTSTQTVSNGSGSWLVNDTNLLHLGQNHRGDFLWRESLGLFQVFNFNQWVTVGVDDLERPCLDILADRVFGESTTDQTLSVENGVSWVQSSAVLSSITDQSLFWSESDKRWGNSVTLFVGNDFNCGVISSNT